MNRFQIDYVDGVVFYCMIAGDFEDETTGDSECIWIVPGFEPAY